MIRRLTVCRAAGTDPYENLALEQTLLERVREQECILYLWQNARTVVIGRNQNPWKECRTALLEEEGGHLARRLSGGGAVFHDLGNLNFTFLMREADYDLDRQLTVIETACRSLGIPVERSGRNDLLADGRKFSGNAFYHHNGRAYHHGTLMVDVDLEMVQRYLSPSKAKLAAKGVDSVRSRVVNLREFVPTLTVRQLSDALTAAFAEVYDQAIGNRQQAIEDRGRGESPVTNHQSPEDGESGSKELSTEKAFPLGAPVGRALCGRWQPASPASRMPDEGRPMTDQAAGAHSARPPETPGKAFPLRGRCPSAHTGADEVGQVDELAPEDFDLTELTEKYRSDAWLYGPKMPFTLSVEDRFPWGGVEIQLQVNEGIIRAAKVYTDAMNETLAPRLEAVLTDCAFRPTHLHSAVSELHIPSEQEAAILLLLASVL